MENNEQKNQRFLTLLSFGKTISSVGWVIIVIYLVSVFLGLRSCADGSKVEGTMMFIFGVFTAGIGYILVAQGQVISCFVSIENNTHKISKLMTDLIEKISGKENSYF